MKQIRLAFDGVCMNSGNNSLPNVRLQAFTAGEADAVAGQVQYSFQQSLFGELMIATSEVGICFAGFSDDREHVLTELKRYLPQAHLQEGENSFHTKAIEILSGREHRPELSLHVKASVFQLKVWEFLLNIPFGQQSTYQQIADHLGDPNAARAVGAAVGANPVAFFIPCHRVLHSTGKVGQYHWGSERKRALLNWEMNQFF